MIEIVWSLLAMVDGPERKFPASRHRSQRIRKKLIKRHAGEFVKIPGIYQIGDKFIAHPSLKSEIERKFAKGNEVANDDTNFLRNPWRF